MALPDEARPQSMEGPRLLGVQDLRCVLARFHQDPNQKCALTAPGSDLDHQSNPASHSQYSHSDRVSLGLSVLILVNSGKARARPPILYLDVPEIPQPYFKLRSSFEVA